MSYDHWKATNPQDEWLGPEPLERDDMSSRDGVVARFCLCVTERGYSATTCSCASARAAAGCNAH